MALPAASDNHLPMDAMAVLQALPSPLLLLDGDDRIVFANIAAEQFFRGSLKVLSGMVISDIIPATSPLFELINSVRNVQASANEYEMLIGTPRTGGQRLVDVQASAVVEQPGCVLLNVQQRSVAQKIDSQLTHRGAARTVSGLAAMLAHEIKNPLSGIRGAAQLIAPALTGDDRTLAKLITDETDRIRGLVDQMEVFSDDRPIERVAINIHSILDHVKSLAVSGFAKNLTIKEQYDPSLPSVFGNRDQLVQVFLNLIKNAAEAIIDAGEQGDITLTTAFRPGIKLSGPGGQEKLSLPLEVGVHNSHGTISAHLLPHVFEPFVSSKSSGRGLGLALVAKIIRDHGGVVDCQSSDEQTTFRVLLPLYTENKSAGPNPS